MRRQRWGVSMISALVALAATGCGTVLTRGGEPDIPENPPPVAAVKDITPPLLTYMLDADKVITLINGQQVLAVRCARQFGYRGDPVIYPANSQPAEYDGIFSRRYGLVSRESARKYGYATSPEEWPRLLPETVVSPQDFTQPEREIFEGVTGSGAPSTVTAADGRRLPEGGCLKEAWRQMGPASSSVRDFVADGLAESYNRMASDSRAKAVQKAYAQCMHDRGYPQVTVRGEQALYSGKPDGPEGVKAAVDDVTCAQQVNLPGILYALDTAYQQRWIDKHEAELRQGAADREAALHRARQAIAEGV